MHHCQGLEDKVGTRTNEFKSSINKLRTKVSGRFLITRDIRVWKNSFFEERMKKSPNSFKEQFMEIDPTALPIIAQERTVGPTRLYLKATFG